jgi:retron-type reverse transcriptase
MKPIPGTGQGDRPRTPSAKCGERFKSGRLWIVDADLKDLFGSLNHEKLLTLVAQQVAEGRILCLIRAMLQAGSWSEGRLYSTERGTLQGSVISPLLSNVPLTPLIARCVHEGIS